MNMSGTTVLKKEEKLKAKLEFKNLKLLEKIDKKNTPLHTYTQKGWVSEIKKIIGNVDLDLRNYYGLTALEIAKERKHIEIIELIENQIEINNRLFKAMESEDFEKMKIFIDLGANVNLRNHNSYMPIHLSIFWKDTRALEKLIEMNVDLNSKDEKGWTPLMVASNYGKYEHVLLLLEKGVDVNVKDNYDWTALELARDRIINIGLEIQDDLDKVVEILNSIRK
jgi:ankyrin repeat protein